MLNSFALEALLKNTDFEDLRDFFLETWKRAADENETGYRYVVFFAQKCQGLNLIFLTKELEKVDSSDLKISKKVLNRIRDYKFLSQDGLLLKVEELTNAYLTDGFFPRILVVDELAIYGRDFNEFMYTLENAILEVWNRKADKAMSDDDYYTIHHQLTAAVDFFVYRFAKNRRNTLDTPNTLLLDNVLGSCIKGTFKWMESNEWCSFAQLLSKGLYFDNHVDSSAFLPTFVLNQNAYELIKDQHRLGDSFRWGVKRWRYQGRNLWIWCNSECEQTSSGVLPFFACKLYKERNCVHITPYLFLNNITLNCTHRLFKCLLDFFSIQYSQSECYFSELFRYDYEGLNSVRLKLALSMLSVLFFFEFLEDANQLEVYEKNDWAVDTERGRFTQARIKRICESFGGVSSAYSDYLHFCEFALHNRNEAKSLKESLLRILTEEMHTNGISSYSIDSQNGKDAYLLRAENYFWHIDVLKHEQINKKFSEKSRFSAKASYRLRSGLYDYINSFGEGYKSTSMKLSALVVLFEHGIVGNDVYYQDEEIHYLKVGESVTHIASQHLYRFIPALITLERTCTINGLIFQVWAGRFGAYLNKCLPNNNTDYEELFWQFAHDMYLCGYRIEDWNMGDVFELDIPSFTPGIEVRTLQEWNGMPWSVSEQTEFSRMDRNDYISWELERQEEYRDLVFSFFSEMEQQTE